MTDEYSESEDIDDGDSDTENSDTENSDTENSDTENSHTENSYTENSNTENHGLDDGGEDSDTERYGLWDSDTGDSDAEVHAIDDGGDAAGRQAVTAGVYRRRRLVVGASAVTAVALLIGVLVAVTGGDGDERLGAVELTTTTSTTTTTMLPPTTTASTSNSTSNSTSTTPSTTTTTTSTTTTSTTTTTVPPPTTILDGNGVPVWPPYEIKPALDGVAALTGLPADDAVTQRPILAVKIDNRPQGRPQWGLDTADAIIEENVEGITRFVALFHTNLPDRAGPVRSARTGDLDMLAAMNRPVLGWSGGNPGVTAWVRSAASSRLLVDFSAQSNPCYQRTSNRRAPHNLLLDPACAVTSAFEPGPAQPLWAIDAGWTPPEGFVVNPDSSFDVAMDGVTAGWTWEPGFGVYLRLQNGNRHVAISGDQIAVSNVVEIYTAHPPSPVDARSPNPITVGFGPAIIHRDGVAIEGAWTRSTPYEPFSFIDRETGEPILLDEGRTFIELARG